MKKKDWNEGLNHLDPEIVEKYTYRKDKLRQKQKAQSVWLRIGVIAACLAFIVSALIVVPMLQEDDPKPLPLPETTQSGSDTTADEEETTAVGEESTTPSYITLPPISIIQSGKEIADRTNITCGNTGSSSGSEAEMYSPGFYIQTVVYATVIEVLPDTYYVPGRNTEYRVARLSVIDSIRGEGLPQEIFFRFPYYSAGVFEGYDAFIFSLDQVGIENYLMINDTKKEATYFADMFQIATVDDLGYGSVIAFNNEKVDVSFWDRVRHYNVSAHIDTMLSDPQTYLYPVGRDTTLEEAKANIAELAQKDNMFTDEVAACDYVAAEDIFISDESKQIKNHLTSSSFDVFKQTISIGSDSIVAQYTRLINGFETDEKIVIRVDKSSKTARIEKRGEPYTSDDLERIPNIGEVLENMALYELKPPHLEIVDGLHFAYSTAEGGYRKVDGKIYGIICLVWSYTCDNLINGYISDDCYYLYDENGNGWIVERDDLRKLLGDEDWIVKRFDYEWENEWYEEWIGSLS